MHLSQKWENMSWKNGQHSAHLDVKTRGGPIPEESPFRIPFTGNWPTDRVGSIPYSVAHNSYFWGNRNTSCSSNTGGHHVTVLFWRRLTIPSWIMASKERELHCQLPLLSHHRYQRKEGQKQKGPYLNDVHTGMGRGLQKSKRRKVGCYSYILHISTKCTQIGPQTQKLCRRHLRMAPKNASDWLRSSKMTEDAEIREGRRWMGCVLKSPQELSVGQLGTKGVQWWSDIAKNDVLYNDCLKVHACPLTVKLVTVTIWLQWQVFGRKLNLLILKIMGDEICKL